MACHHRNTKCKSGSDASTTDPVEDIGNEGCLGVFNGELPANLFDLPACALLRSRRRGLRNRACTQLSRPFKEVLAAIGNGCGHRFDDEVSALRALLAALWWSSLLVKLKHCVFERFIVEVLVFDFDGRTLEDRGT